MRGGLGVLFEIGFIDLFTYFENDLDKVLTIFVPLLRRWYEDDSIAFKVCTTVELHFFCAQTKVSCMCNSFFPLCFSQAFAMASFHTVR